MMSHEEVIQSVTAHMATIQKREARLVRKVIRAYATALTDIRTRVAARLQTLGDTPTPSQIRSMGNDVMLIRAIEARLAILEDEFVGIFREEIPVVARMGILSGSEEVLIIAKALGVELFEFSINPLLEPVIESTIQQIPGEIAKFKGAIVAELRAGLSAGEPIPALMRRVFQRTPVDGRSSTFKRGMVSAELLTRRAVVQASNNAKAIYLEETQQQLPQLRKQAVASINGRTSDTCLRVHGQIKPINKPFDLSGTARFARRMMAPPFHWNCRTTVAAYHPVFEEGGVTTADMRREAKQELNNR